MTDYLSAAKGLMPASAIRHISRSILRSLPELQIAIMPSIRYEQLLNAKRSHSLCSAEMDKSRSEDILDKSAM